MKKYFIYGILLTTFLFSFYTPTFALDICVITEQKLSRIIGVVKDKNYSIPNAEVVLKRKNKEEVLQKVKANEDGQFEFSKVSKGKNIIIVIYPNAKTLYVPVKVVKNKSYDKKYLEIIMQFTIGGCDEEVRTLEKLN